MTTYSKSVKDLEPEYKQRIDDRMQFFKSQNHIKDVPTQLEDPILPSLSGSLYDISNSKYTIYNNNSISVNPVITWDDLISQSEVLSTTKITLEDIKAINTDIPQYLETHNDNLSAIIKKINEDTNLSNTIPELPPDSVFNQAKWKNQENYKKNHPTNLIPPKTIYHVLSLFSYSIISIIDICNMFKISHRSLETIRNLYSEVEGFYQKCYLQKSEAYGEEAIKLYEGTIDDLPASAWEKTREGKRLQMAAIKYRADKYNALIRHAQIHETRSYVNKTVSENINKNLNVQADIKDLEELLQGEAKDMGKHHDFKRLNTRQ